MTSSANAYPEVTNLHGPGKGTNPGGIAVRPTYGFEPPSKPAVPPNAFCTSCSIIPSKARMDARTRETRDGNENSEPSLIVIFINGCPSLVTFTVVAASSIDWPIL